MCTSSCFILRKLEVTTSFIGPYSVTVELRHFWPCIVISNRLSYKYMNSKCKKKWLYQLLTSEGGWGGGFHYCNSKLWSLNFKGLQYLVLSVCALVSENTKSSHLRFLQRKCTCKCLVHVSSNCNCLVHVSSVPNHSLLLTLFESKSTTHTSPGIWNPSDL